MNEVDVNDLDALTLHLRSKTPLGRLNEVEVRVVLDHLAELGMTFAPPAPIFPDFAPIGPKPHDEADFPPAITNAPVFVPAAEGDPASIKPASEGEPPALAPPPAS